MYKSTENTTPTVSCAWGNHDATAIGHTPNGVAICATCAPLSGLAVR